MSKGLNKNRYWNLYETPPSDENALDFEKSALKYRELLAEAVMARYKSAAAPVFTLSGGLDSSSVMASVVSQTGQKQIAYSSVYSDATYDESDEIKSMLDQCVSNWNAINIEPKNIFDSVSEMVRIHNEPVATATWLSHYLLAGKISADKYATVFGGLGGDELNAGEYEYFFYYFADLKRNGEDKNLDHEIKMWAQHHDHPIFKKNKDVAARGWTLLTDQKIPGKCLADRARIDRYRATVNQNYFDVASFDPVMDKVFNSYLKNRTYHDLFRETMPCCVRAEDRHGAYFGLENSLPFLDHKLVEFMFSMPSSWKIKNGVTKILLREAMKGVLPEETRARIKKMGWNAPAHIWFSKSFFGELFDLVHSETFMRRGLYEAAEVQRLLSEHRAIVEGRESTDNHMMFFWQLLNMELWLRWVDEERKNAPLFEQS
jgi:asparagine synthase (glutamine-hydrolysing)